MKRIILLTLTLVLVMITLPSCIMIPLHKSFEIDTATVSSIEIYDLYGVDNSGGEFVKTETPVYKIPEENHSDFLSDLSEIQFSDTIIIMIAAIDPSFYYDQWTVRINYTDGSFELISCGGYGESFDENGEYTNSHHYGCDDEEWSAFIGKYVPEEIFEHSHETE